MVKLKIAVTAILLVLAPSARALKAAEVSCALTWGDNNGAYREIDRQKQSFPSDFPSGRIPSPATCLEMMIRGKLVAGDATKVALMIRNHHPFLERVLLWSSGGSVEEALKIGKYIRRELIETQAPSEMHTELSGSGFLIDPRRPLDKVDYTLCDEDITCHCASACFLIYAAGYHRVGNAIGLHRPSTQSMSFANLPPDQASGLYREALVEINHYLTEMEVPRRYIEMMIDTSSNDIRWLEYFDAESLQDVPSVAEWLSAGCGSMSKSEEKVLLDLIGAKDLLSSQEKKLRDELSVRSIDIDVCQAKKIRNSRDAVGEFSVK
jgi:hypothetical protein